MCGIAGFIGSLAPRPWLVPSSTRPRWRGAARLRRGVGLQLGQRRPAILDIAGGAQPACQAKFVLKTALNGLLPGWVLQRKKQGFGVPVGHWLAELGWRTRAIFIRPRARPSTGC